MRRRLDRYTLELLFLLSGAVGSALEEIIVHRTDIAFILLFITVMLTIWMAAIRSDLSAQVDDALGERDVISKVDPRWRQDAQAEIAKARGEIALWVGGTRHVELSSALRYQVEVLDMAKMSVRAIHVAMDRESLMRWQNPQNRFQQLVEKYRTLPSSVRSRRILVLNIEDVTLSTVTVDGQRVITDAVLDQVCRFQMATRPTDGLGVELRILWVSPTRLDITDLLLVDDTEACSIQNDGRGQFSDLVACIGSVEIDRLATVFEVQWSQALPAERYLANPAAQP